MEIDRQIACHLMEIKRSLPHAKQREFNISSPAIKRIVLDVHCVTTNVKTKTLAAAFLKQAGRTREAKRQKTK
jgi:hypothetical protein